MDNDGEFFIDESSLDMVSDEPFAVKVSWFIVAT